MCKVRFGADAPASSLQHQAALLLLAMLNQTTPADPQQHGSPSWTTWSGPQLPLTVITVLTAAQSAAAAEHLVIGKGDTDPALIDGCNYYQHQHPPACFLPPATDRRVSLRVGPSIER